MTEIKEAQFLRAKQRENQWDTLAEAENKKWHPFHQLATATKISRKRLKGVLMAAGFYRDEAEYALDEIREKYGSYIKWWDCVAPTYIYTLDRRLRAYNAKKRAKRDWLENLLFRYGEHNSQQKLKEEFEELKKIAEKYPDLNSVKDCREAKNKLLYEASEPTDELDDEGFPIRYIRQELSAETFAKIKEIVKLEKYFAWGAEA